MFDILDTDVSPCKLGMVSTEPRRLAREAVGVVKELGVPTTVFIDSTGAVLAQPAAYATDHSIDDVVGIYTPSMDVDGLTEDLRDAVTPRLASMGILAG